MQTTNSSGGTKSSAFIFTTLTLVHNMCMNSYTQLAHDTVHTRCNVAHRTRWATQHVPVLPSVWLESIMAMAVCPRYMRHLTPCTPQLGRWPLMGDHVWCPP